MMSQDTQSKIKVAAGVYLLCDGKGGALKFIKQ